MIYRLWFSLSILGSVVVVITFLISVLNYTRVIPRHRVNTLTTDEEELDSILENSEVTAKILQKNFIGQSGVYTQVDEVKNSPIDLNKTYIPGSRWLLSGQTENSENGIYEVGPEGILEPAPDFQSENVIKSGAFLYNENDGTMLGLDNISTRPEFVHLRVDPVTSLDSSSGERTTGFTPMALDQYIGNRSTKNITTFTSSATYTVPARVSSILVTVVGGGGSGGGISSGTYGVGAGGFAGGARVALLSVTTGETATVTVGAGGSGSTSTGAAGEDTTFVYGVTTITGTGGPGGTRTQGETATIVASNTATAAVSGSGGTTGTSYYGMKGDSGYLMNGYGIAGIGGSSILKGNNGAVANIDAATNGIDATANTGNGGSGAIVPATGGTATGGNGGSGLVIVQEFF